MPPVHKIWLPRDVEALLFSPIFGSLLVYVQGCAVRKSGKYQQEARQERPFGYGCPRFNGYYYGCERASWVDLTLGLCTALDVGKGWRIQPTVWYSTLLDNRLLADGPNRQNVWFSVELCRAR